MTDFATKDGLIRNLKACFPYVKNVEVSAIGHTSKVLVSVTPPWWCLGFLRTRLRNKIETKLACRGIAWVNYSVSIDGLS
jgi:hypothetical protein